MKHRAIQFDYPEGTSGYVVKNNNGEFEFRNEGSVWHDIELFKKDYGDCVEWFSKLKKQKYYRHLKNARLIPIKIRYSSRKSEPKNIKITERTKIA